MQKIKNNARKKTTRYMEQDIEKVAEYEAKIKKFLKIKGFMLTKPVLTTIYYVNIGMRKRSEEFMKR